MRFRQYPSRLGKEIRKELRKGVCGEGDELKVSRAARRAPSGNGQRASFLSPSI
jgi:hypothetical protein